MQLWKQRLGTFVFYLILTSQLLTGPLTLRKWPFTDYPMFSKAMPKSAEVKLLFLVDQFADGTKVTWQRGDYASFGAFDLRLQMFRDNLQDPRLNRHVKMRVRNRFYHQRPHHILLFKKIAKVEDSKIIEKDVLVKEYEYKTLAGQ